MLALALETIRKLMAEMGVDALSGAGVGVPGPVDFHRGVSVSPPIMPGWDGYPVRDAVSRDLGCPVVLDNDVNVLAIGEQHAGVARPPGTSSSSRSAPASAAASSWTASSTAAWTVAPATSATSGSTTSARPARAATPAASRRSPAVPPWPATRPPRPAPAAPTCWPRCSTETGELSAADVGSAVTQGDPVAVQLIRDSGRRVGQVLASLVSFFNPGLIVIGGGVTGVGHALLAEIRGVTYRRSLPLATGNLPIVLSELGSEGGVIGAARMVSGAIYSSDPSRAV